MPALIPRPGRLEFAPPATDPQGLFTDVSSRLVHRHFETGYNDFERQPLLHKQLSGLGPGVAWLDLDGNGSDDLIVGTGRGGTLAVFRNQGTGTLTRWSHPTWAKPAPDDLTSLVSWSPGAGQRCLLTGLAAYEQTAQTAPPFFRYDLRADQPQALTPQVPRFADSPGPLAVGDLDGDGSLELFVGGRLRAGRYPEPASSVLYRNINGNFQVDPKQSAVLQKVGLVSGAVLSDLTGDGLPELVLACEWGPVRLFANTAGQLRDITAQAGLEKFPGWWNGVNTGDLDGDGRLDIIASNWGLNSSYHDPSQSPIYIFFNDLDQNGQLDLVEAYRDPASDRLVPRRHLALMSTGLPLLRTRFPNHAAYAQADLAAILGQPLEQVPSLQVTTLASMLFLNRGDHFQAVPLPPEAQFAPAFGINVADFDGDGHEDVFLSQNFFGMRPEESRLDAGRGLLLRGTGTAELQPVPGQLSGIKVYGEQRGSAASDFDGDGRVDLAITQRGSDTKLYRNQGARPGLRIRLLGPPGNPDGIGAQLRLVFGERSGPVRELHGGAGYWSQDSLAPVLATPSPPTALWVRWPGGKTVTRPIPADAKALTLSYEGELKVVPFP